MIPRYLLFWTALIPIAITNGIFRQSVLMKLVDERAAGQISVLTGILLIGTFLWFVIRRWPPRSSREAIAIGTIWLVLTVAFEFVLGGVVLGYPWERLLADYNLADGRFWPVLLLFIAVAPWAMSRKRQPASSPRVHEA
jgi:hypothetical protein